MPFRLRVALLALVVLPFIGASTYPPHVNTPPTANAGSEQRRDVGATVTLEGGRSHDPDGDTLVYTWSQIGGVQVVISNSSSVRPTFTAPDEAIDTTLYFQLTVHDGRGAYDTDRTKVDIERPNRQPVANAGPDQSVNGGATVRLNGSANDPDGDNLTYRWRQTRGTPVPIPGFRTLRATFIAPRKNETLEFELTVSDGRGGSDTDTTRVTVTRPNRPPTANAGADQSVNGNATVTLNGSGTDPDNDDLTYTWVQTSGPSVTLSSTTSQNAVFTAPNSNAILNFRLTVLDGRGGSATDTTRVTVARLNRPPTANAGANQNVNGNATVTLNGSGTDPDNDTLSYAWQQTSGPPVTLSSTIAQHPTFTAPNSDAALNFQLTVSDGRGGSDTDTTRVAVTRLNRPPTANAGPDQTVNGGTTVTLNGSGTDPDGDALAYSWQQLSGTIIPLINPSSRRITFTAPNENTILDFRFMVSDGRGRTATDVVRINVLQPNRPPTANAGANQNVNGNATVTLNGSGSDPDGDRLSYSWMVHRTSEQEPVPTVALSDPSAQRPTFIAPNYNLTLNFSLTVTDEHGLSTTDTTRVTVARLNRPPTANAGANQNANGNATVTLNGGGTDPDRDRLSYAWVQIRGTRVTLSSTTVRRPTFTTPNKNETLEFRLTVSDGRGGSATDTTRVTVTRVNQPPTVNAGPDKTANTNAVVSLIGTASDPDGDNLTYSWQQISGAHVSIFVGATSRISAFIAPNTPGAVEYRLTVNDGRGGTATDVVRINVLRPNRPPTANAGANQNVNRNASVTLNGSGTDPDNDDLTYTWVQISGSSVSLSSTIAQYPTFTAPNYNATLEFRLTVNDGRGGTDTDTTRVTVTQPNRSPTANAGPDQTVNGVSSVTLNGSGTDPDGDTLTYSWQQTAGITAKLSSTSAQRPTFTAPFRNTTMNFRLTTSDGRGGHGIDSVAVTVSNCISPPNNRSYYRERTNNNPEIVCSYRWRCTRYEEYFCREEVLMCGRVPC